jgi:hypothetical protein
MNGGHAIFMKPSEMMVSSFIKIQFLVGRKDSLVSSLAGRHDRSIDQNKVGSIGSRDGTGTIF